MKKNRRLFLILFAISLAYTLPVYNKYWAPYDEGIITVAAQRVLAGEVPYRDFFIVMYPPGQIYVLALLYKIFPLWLTAGRIYTVFIGTGIALLVFCMTRLLTQKEGVSVVSWFIALISLVGRLGAIPAPIWPGVFFGLFAVFAFLRYLESTKTGYVIFSGILTGVAILFRHDIGIFAFISIIVSLVVSKLYASTPRYKEPVIYAGSTASVIAPVALYFALNSATSDIVMSLLFFPFVQHKAAALPFPKPCFNPNMIFHGSLHFIKVNQYYIPPLVYLFMGYHLVKAFFKRTLQDKKNLGILAVLLFGTMSFNQVRIRTDPAHLLTAMQPAVVLFGVMLGVHFLKSTPMNKTGMPILPRIKPTTFSLRSGFIIFVLFLFALLGIKNVDKYIKNNFRKVLRKDIIKTQFDVGSVYIPKEERRAVLDTLHFIRYNTHPSERIYIGNIAHWKDDFGGSLILYFLAKRLPSTKYYELLPGLVTDPRVHSEIMRSFIHYNVKLLILQDIELGQNSDRGMGGCELDEYIKHNYKRVKKFGKFNIFMKNTF